MRRQFRGPNSVCAARYSACSSSLHQPVFGGGSGLGGGDGLARLGGWGCLGLGVVVDVGRAACWSAGACWGWGWGLVKDGVEVEDEDEVEDEVWETKRAEDEGRQLVWCAAWRMWVAV